MKLITFTGGVGFEGVDALEVAGVVYPLNVAVPATATAANAFERVYKNAAEDGAKRNRVVRTPEYTIATGDAPADTTADKSETPADESDARESKGTAGKAKATSAPKASDTGSASAAEGGSATGGSSA